MYSLLGVSHFLDDQRLREFERVLGIIKLGNMEIASSQAIIQDVV